MQMKLLDTEIAIERCASIVGVDVSFVKDLLREGRLKSASGTALSFSDLCELFAISRFRHAYFGPDADVPEAAVGISRLPMMAFAALVAQARYGIGGRIIGTTHPSHVPERFVILSGDEVYRSGTMEHFERARAETLTQNASIFIFDTKIAAEYLVNEIEAPPFQWVEAE